MNLYLLRGTCSRAAAIISLIKRSASGALWTLFLAMTAVRAYAHDDEAPAPPDPKSQAAAGQFTIATLSLVTGVLIYYAIQRHSLLHAAEHTPEWGKKMDKIAIGSAIGAAILVWVVSTGLSATGHRPAAH